MRRTTPDLLGRRQSAYQTTSRALLGLTILYVVWTNYVLFAGGNLPLTSISLGSGSAGAGFVMLPFGDLIAVLVVWFVVDAALLNLLHMILRTGRRRRPISIPGQGTQASPAAPAAPAAPATFAPYPAAGAQQSSTAQQSTTGQQGSTLVNPPGSDWRPPAAGPDSR